MDVFRDRNDIFNESFLLRNIQIMVRVGNDLLTKKRFCLLQFGSKDIEIFETIQILEPIYSEQLNNW